MIDMIMIVIVFGTGVVIGMYITTQLSHWIDGRTNNRKLLDNIDSMDKNRAMNSGREWDHMDSKDKI
tara:strand:+ start:4819 stop:5019 length:201 start_codon:yes stop_codon:yes gene_type:complete